MRARVLLISYAIKSPRAQAIAFKRLNEWLKFFRLESLGFRIVQKGEVLRPEFTEGYHASGHVSQDDLQRIIDEIDPDVLIPVHTQHPEAFEVMSSKVAHPDAMVGRNGRGYDLGYKLHLSVDPFRILPLAILIAPANDNEKKHAPSLVERTRMVLGRAGARLRRLIGDSQFSSGKVRSLVGESVIPYTSNQRGEGVLRVDRRFRTHGPIEMVARYRRRPLVESAFSFLKDQYGLRVNNVRGLVNVGVYALLSVLCIVLNREAAENVGRPDKAVSPTFFNT